MGRRRFGGLPELSEGENIDYPSRHGVLRDSDGDRLGTLRAP